MSNTYDDDDARPQVFETYTNGDRLPDGADFLDAGRSRVELVGDPDANVGPLSWANSAAVTLDPDEDSITVSISTGDPRGAFTMTIRRIPDDAPTNAGALVMGVPYPGDPMPHEDLHPIRPGAYMVGGAA